MGKSQRLRLCDVREVFHLLGECRELGSAAQAWRPHMLSGLCRLTGAQLCVGGLARHLGPEKLLTPIDFADHGWPDAKCRAQFLVWMKDPTVLNNLVVRRFHELAGRCVTRTRQQLVDDRAYYASSFHNQVNRSCGLDHGLLSRHTPPEREFVHELALNRTMGERPFGRRECHLVHLLQQEIVPLLARALATLPESRLPPRLRQTLDALLEGDSEKEAALRLGLSVHTIHEYVNSLYRVFSVSSRAELLAHFLRRARGNPTPT